MVKKVFEKYKSEIMSNKRQFYLSIFLILLAILLNFFSGQFVTLKGASTPSDLILNLIPPTDLSIVYILLILITSIFFFYHPLKRDTKNFSYVLCMFSLFIIIRAGFVILTHLKVPDDAVSISVGRGIYDALVFPNKMFFAGQVGLSFLGFLIFKETKMKELMLFCSILLSIVLLAMHQHYSIDILAAYFITYGIFKIGESIFEYEK